MLVFNQKVGQGLFEGFGQDKDTRIDFGLKGFIEHLRIQKQIVLKSNRCLSSLCYFLTLPNCYHRVVVNVQLVVSRCVRDSVKIL